MIRAVFEVSSFEQFLDLFDFRHFGKNFRDAQGNLKGKSSYFENIIHESKTQN